MKKIRLRMNTPTEVKRTLARVSNMVLNKEIEPKAANVIIYACNAILSTIRIDEQERRIDELEKLIEDLTAEE